MCFEIRTFSEGPVGLCFYLMVKNSATIPLASGKVRTYRYSAEHMDNLNLKKIPIFLFHKEEMEAGWVGIERYLPHRARLCHKGPQAWFSAVSAILKFIIVLSLNLCFISKAQRNNRECAWGQEVCAICMLSGLVASFACCIHDSPGAKNSGGHMMHRSSVTHKASIHVLVGRSVPRLRGAVKQWLLFSVGSTRQATAKYSSGTTLHISFQRSLSFAV